MKHVILITTSFPQGDNGQDVGSSAAGSFVMDFASELSNHLKVSVVTPGLSTGSTRTENLTVHRFAVDRLPLASLQAHNPAHWLPILSTLRNGQKHALRVATDHSPDYVLALWAFPSGYWAKKIARTFNVPYGVWALGSDIWTLGKIPLVRSILASILVNANDRYADGLRLAQDVQRLCGECCSFLPSTRDLEPATHKKLKRSPPYRIVFLGRWHPNKGVDLLLQALNDFAEDNWQKIEDIRIFGGGPLSDNVVNHVQGLQAKGKPITHGGYLDKSEAAALLSGADYVVIPSRIESIPVIFSDCMKSRCAIISTPVGDLPELLQKYHAGICAQDTTAEALQQAITAALESAPLHYEDGINAAAQDFDLPCIVRNFLKSASLA